MRAVCAALLLGGCQVLFPLQADDGGMVDGAPDAALVEHNVAFVTGGVFPGDFGGLAVADQKCQEAAEAAELPTNTYVAWLSARETNAIDRLAGARGWVRSDGQPVADRPSSLTAVGPLVPLALNEDGQNVLTANSPTKVWTGTEASGAKSTERCDEWTLPTRFGMYGLVGHGGVEFTSPQVEGCGQSLRLYCFGIGHAQPLELPPPEATTSYFFVSDGAWPAVDRSAADALCALEASAANLPGSYLAVLPLDGEALSARFDTTRVYSRVDGVVLGPILSGSSITYPLLSASKQASYAMVWTAAFATGTPSSTCNNWTGTGGGVVGLPYVVPPLLMTYGALSCNSPNVRVYCARVD